MNKDQIIQMAREAGLIHETHEGNWHLEQFAKLIRAVTKDEDAKICDDEIASWKRVTNGDCDDEEKALTFVQKAILASK